MTIDVASLVFEIDSTQAVVARERLEALEKAGASVDATATRTKSASDKANAAHREAAAQITKLVEKVGAYEAALGSAGKAGAFDKVQAEAAKEAAAWQKVEDAIQRRNAAYRGDLAAQQLKDTERAALDEARALAQSAAEWDKIQAALERRNAALRGDLAAKQALDNAKALAVEEKAWERIDAALDKRNAKLRGEQAIAALKAEAEAVTSLEARIDKLMNSIDPTRAAQARLNAEMQEAAALYKAGAISSSDYARATSVLDQRLAEAARGHDAYAKAQGRVAGSSGAVARAGLNMGRQFTDIGVQLAGQTPLHLVLIQQLPQIADGFAQAKLEGAGFSAVMKGMFAPFAVVGASLVAVAALATGAAIGFGLLHRELSKGYPRDVTDGLGLTEEQLKRVKDRSVDMGDTFRATMDVAAKYLSQGPLGEAIDWVGKQWNSFLDDLAANTVKEMATVVGVFVGAYRFIVQNWRNFPAVFGDFFAMGVNVALEAVERLVNGAVKGLNSIFAVMRMTPQWSWLPNLQEVNLQRAQVSSAAEFMGRAFKANVTQEIENALKGMGRLGKEIDRGAVKLATDKAQKDAGDPNKVAGSRAPRDTSDERAAQLAQLIAQAKAEELQAQLALSEDTRKRAEIERRLIDIQLAGQLAQLDRQAASIKDDAGLSDARKAALLLQLEGVRILQANIAGLKSELIDREASRRLIHDEYELRAGLVEDHLAILSSQRDLARYATDRNRIERLILEDQQQLRRAKQLEVLATISAASAEYKRAQDILQNLDQLDRNERDAQRLRDLERATDAATSAIRDVANAISAHDWGRLFTTMVAVVDQAIAAFAAAKTGAERAGAAGSIFSAAGSAIGGAGGSVLGAVGSGLSAYSTAAGAAGTMGSLGGAIAGLAGPIGIAVAGFSLLSGLLGNRKAEKEARMQAELAKQQAEHQRALAITNARREQEIRLLELTGKASEALKLRREAELAAMDASLQANQLRIWQLEDEAEAAEKAKAAARDRANLEIRLMEALGNSAGALAAKRAQELDSTDAANRALLSQIFAAEDAAQRVADAREALSLAYEREAAALRSTKDRMLDFIKSFSEFRKSLDPLLDADVSMSLERTRRDFLAAQAGAATGDEAAMKALIANGQAFASASEANAETLLQHQINIATIQNGMRAAEAAASNQATMAEQQLAALDASVAGILQVNQSVLSVRDALAAYQAAVAAQKAIPTTPAPPPVTAAQPTANDNTPAIPRAPDWASYIRSNPDVAAEYARLSPNNLRNNLGVTSIEQFGQWHWQHFGQAEGRKPYATGGIMDRPITLGESGIGGEAGPEAILPLTNVGGKMGVHAVGPDFDEVVAELRALRSEVAQLRANNSTENQAIARSSAQLARDVRQIVDEGVEVHGDTPDAPVRVKNVA